MDSHDEQLSLVLQYILHSIPFTRFNIFFLLTLLPPCVYLFIFELFLEPNLCSESSSIRSLRIKALICLHSRKGAKARRGRILDRGRDENSSQESHVSVVHYLWYSIVPQRNDSLNVFLLRRHIDSIPQKVWIQCSSMKHWPFKFLSHLLSLS